MTDHSLADHPIVFDPPLWTADSIWNVHVPFGLLLIDLLRPRTIVQLGLGDAAAYFTVCQAVQSLGLASRAWVIDPAPAADAERDRQHTARYAGFSTIVPTDYADSVGAIPPDSVDLLVVNTSALSQYAAAQAALDAWLPRLSQRGVVLFHPTFPPPGAMGDAWRVWHDHKASADSYERLDGAGIGLLLIGADERERLGLLFNPADDRRWFTDTLLHRLGSAPGEQRPNHPVTAAAPKHRDRILASTAPTEPPLHDYALPHGYRSRVTVVDRQPTAAAPGTARIDDLYEMAIKLAQSYDCTYIIDLGAGRPELLTDATIARLAGVTILGIDLPGRVRPMTAERRSEWIDWDFDQAGTPPLPTHILQRAVIVCSGLLEQLAHPEHLLATLRTWLHEARAAVISTPDRERVSGYAHFGPPLLDRRIREWTQAEFASLLRTAGLRVEFMGHMRSYTDQGSKQALAAVLLPPTAPLAAPAPIDFRVTAIVPAYNEADVLAYGLRDLIDQGISVYVIDNWSQDDGYAIADAYLGHGVIGVERFPEGGRGDVFEWANILKRIVHVSNSLDTDWVVLCAADQIFESPWPHLTLRDAIYWADCGGYEIINHSMMEYRPVDESFIPYTNHKTHFKFWEWGAHLAYRNLHQCWKRSLALDFGISGGHQLVSAPRQIAPFHHTIRHYTHRSEAHGRRKLLERQRNEYERRLDWGAHNRYFASLPRLTRDPLTLTVRDDTFYAEQLPERLFGVGIFE